MNQQEKEKSFEEGKVWTFMGMKKRTFFTHARNTRPLCSNHSDSANHPVDLLQIPVNELLALTT